MLKVCIVGYLRPEQNFSSLEALIAAINNDILQAEQHLKNTESIQLKHSEYFRWILWLCTEFELLNKQYLFNCDVINQYEIMCKFFYLL